MAGYWLFYMYIFYIVHFFYDNQYVSQ